MVDCRILFINPLVAKGEDKFSNTYSEFKCCILIIYNMSLVAHYKLNDPDTLTTDSAGSFNLTNVGGVGTVTDTTYGTAASFAQTSVQEDVQYLHTTAVPDAIGGNPVRTYSAWVRPTGTGTHIIHGQAEVGATHIGEHQLMIENGFFTILYDGKLTNTTTRVVFDTWYNIVVTYDGTTERMYINGLFALSRNTTYNTHTTGFAIGHHLRYVNGGYRGFGFDGQILDYRIYDDALSAGDITSLYNDGPNPNPTYAAPLTLAPRALGVSVDISPVDGATAYRLTSQKTGETKEKIEKDNFTGLTQMISNMTPETEYTLRLYSTAGSTYELVFASTVFTLANSASSYDVNEFLGTSGTFDLSTLDSASVELISNVMNEIFTTGDAIDIVVPGGRGTKTSKFVNMGGNIAVADSEALVAPFSKDAGPGQSVTLTLSDSSVVVLSYDETTEAITIGETSYTSGDSFVLDGKKATLVDI